MQYPLRMTHLGVEAIVGFVRTGRKPENTPGPDFHGTGVTLVTDEARSGHPVHFLRARSEGLLGITL